MGLLALAQENVAAPTESCLKTLYQWKCPPTVVVPERPTSSHFPRAIGNAFVR